MNLDDIANASLCVLDTNILLYAEQGYSHQAQRLLRRCSTGELTCILPQTVWHELTHRLMLAEAEMLGRVSGPNAARKLARQKGAIKSFGLCRDMIRVLVNPGLGYMPCTSNKLGKLGFLPFTNLHAKMTNTSS